MSKVEIDTQLKEYEALRNEILWRLRMQHQVIIFALTVTGAAISFFPYLLQNEMYSLLLLLSALYFVFGWHYFEQDFLIAHVASYIEQSLRKQVIKSCSDSNEANDKLLSWEEFRNKIVFQNRWGNLFYTWLTLFRLVPTVGLGFLSIFAFIYIKSVNVATASAWKSVDILLLIIDCFLGVSMVWVGFMAYVSYSKIVDQKKD